MTINDWVGIISGILVGLATCIPLVVKLIKYIRTSIREKNWDKLIRLVMNLMQEAEGRFETGVDRKVWVMQALDSLSDTIDYDIDKDAVSALIDAMCAMSRVVNAPNKEM